MTDRVLKDFDRIAQAGALAGEGWNHNEHYHDYLLGYVPAGCERALDLGCGAGAFTRRLARRARHVLGIDLSQNMIDAARERSDGLSNVDYRVADATRWEWPVDTFDCVASIATLHHLPLDETLERMGRALRPGGTLLVLDLFQNRGAADLLRNVAAAPLAIGLRVLHTGRLRDPAEVRRAWAEHARHDVFPTIDRVRTICRMVLPGAAVRRHLLWRYSIVWRKGAIRDTVA